MQSGEAKVQKSVGRQHADDQTEVMGDRRGELVAQEHGGKIRRGGGRPRGTPNKFNAQLKEALVLASQYAGDLLRLEYEDFYNCNATREIDKEEQFKDPEERARFLEELREAEVLRQFGGIECYMTWLALKHPDVFVPTLARLMSMEAQPNERWSRLSEQNLRVDKWNVCQG
jgi:hypothetical protein